MNSYVTVTADFSSAHLYSQPLWSSEKNRAEFGRCHTEHGHGHNYRAQATFAGGEAAALQLALNEVVRVLDHEHMNFVIPEFRAPPPGKPAVVPTTENVSLWIWERLKKGAHGGSLTKLRVFETEDLWVEIEA